MSRSIIIHTTTRYRRYRLKDTARPLTIIDRHLYRTDDRLMIRSTSTDDSLILYDIDAIQPASSAELVSCDTTMAFMDIGRRSGRNKGASVLGPLANVSFVHLMYIFVAIVVVAVTLSGGLF